MYLKSLLKYIVVFVLAMMVSATILYLFVKPTYVATSIIYPPSTHNPEFLLTGGLKFGDEKEVNEHIELLQSNQVLERMVHRFDLQKHYALKETDHWMQNTIKKLKKNIEIKRSTFRSLHVSVTDQNAQMSAELSNGLVQEADLQLSELVKSSIEKDLIIIEKIYQKKQEEVQILKDSLAFLEKKGFAIAGEVSGLNPSIIKFILE